MTRRVPVLLVSGYLGSGKTTLVRWLLADAQRRGVRVAVITNELGELGIDGALLGSARDDTVELAGGCICCRLSDAFVETLEDLHQRVQPDRVIVETSGVALPYETQLQLWREPVSRWIGDDVAVVVVGAEQLAAGISGDDLFAQQISSADLLVLNQLDRVAAGAIPGLEARLRQIEPDAPILRAVHARVEPDLLFPPDPAGLRAARRASAAPPPPHTHVEFQSEEIALEPGLSSAALLARLRALGALRIKGFAETREGLRVVQGVGARIELIAFDGPLSRELVGRAVVIRRLV
ncbi:MAG: CobW family GTP-binding protein [Candidatus Limnocylindria bacterium]